MVGLSGIFEAAVGSVMMSDPIVAALRRVAPREHR